MRTYAAITLALLAITSIAAAQASLTNWVGVWSESFYGGPLNICSNGNGQVTGSYSNVGVFHGAFSGRTLEGYWHDAGSDPDTTWGFFRVRIPANVDDNSRFAGQFWYGAEADGNGPYNWNGVHLSFNEPNDDLCFRSDERSLVGIWWQDARHLPTTLDEDEQKDSYFALCINTNEGSGDVAASFFDYYLMPLTLASEEEDYDADDDDAVNGTATVGTPQSGYMYGFTVDGGATFQGSWHTITGPASGGDVLWRSVGSDSARGWFWNGQVGTDGASFHSEQFATFADSDTQIDKPEKLRDECDYNSAATIVPSAVLLLATVAVALL